MAKKITNKQKKQYKIKVFIFIIICLMSAGSYLYIKFTTAPDLESVIANVVFDTSEVTIDVTLSNKNEKVNYIYTISDKNNYIKSVKTIDTVVETNIVYLENSIYYLYVDKGTPNKIELTYDNGVDMFNNLKLEVQKLNDYLDIDYNSIKYYTYTEELISFSSYKNYVFYDYEIGLSDNKLINMKQTFTVNNIINTVSINVDYNTNIVIPE